MLPALSAFAPLLTTIFKTVDKAIPDKDLAEKLKAEMNMQLVCFWLETNSYVLTYFNCSLELYS
jgi:hypothetical protein